MCSYITPECDNRTSAHLLEEKSGKGGIVAHCIICRRTYYLRTNKNGAPDKKQYAKLFYRDIVQPNKPLYYKIHKHKMNIGEIKL